MRVILSNETKIYCRNGTKPEDILVRASCVMMRTEHAKVMFKEGLSRVGRSVSGSPNKDGYTFLRR
jgi:hypothetical protein